MSTKINPEVSNQYYRFVDRTNHQDLLLLDRLTRTKLEYIASIAPSWMLPILKAENKRREMMLFLINAHEVLELISEASSNLSVILTHVGSDDPFDYLLKIIEYSALHLGQPVGWLMRANDNYFSRLKHGYNPTEDVVSSLAWLQHNHELVKKQIDAIERHRIPRQRQIILNKIQRLSTSRFEELSKILNSNQALHPETLMRLKKIPTDLLIQ